MLDLVPTNDAIRPVGDGWEYRHNHVDDLSLYTDHCRIRRIPIVAMRPYLSGKLISLCRMTSFSQRKPRSFPRGTYQLVT